MPRTGLHVSDAAGTGSTVLLPGPWWLRVLTNTLPFLYSASTCPRRNNITPCYCSSMSQSTAIHNTKRLVWENIIVVLVQNGKRGLAGGEQRRTLSLSEPQTYSTVASSSRSSLLPQQGEHSQMTERWFIIGLRQLQTGLALPQSTCKAA